MSAMQIIAILLLVTVAILMSLSIFSLIFGIDFSDLFDGDDDE